MTNASVRSDSAPLSASAFAELGLVPELLKALEAEGYTTPTPIQLKAIPSVLEGRDLLGIAQTGTGKTAAFALPILQRLMADRKPAPRKGCRALILSPTRELATQISESFKTYGRHTGMQSGVIFGGVGYKPQINLLSRGVDVLVATPGRLIDLMQEGHLSLSSTEILVLDEADQMMDLGFIRPLRQIVAKLSHKRQSLFFSATMPQEIGSLAAELLREPVQVSVTPVAKTADRVVQQVIHVEASKKRALLVELLANADLSRVLIFTRTKRGADKVARHLEAAGISSAAIHGNKSQNQREAALDGFKRSKIRVLVATDIAARGIDVDSVSHVVNYELPNVPESYVHRIGRTARAGAEGIAISLVDGEEKAYLRDIERLTRQQIPAEDRRNDHSLVATATPDEKRERDPRAGRPQGRRPDARTNASRPRSGTGDGRTGGADRGPRSDRPSSAGGFNAHGGDRPSSRPMGERSNGYRPASDRAPAGSLERRPYDPMNAAPTPIPRPAPRADDRRDSRPAPRADDRRDARPAPRQDARPERRDEASPTRATRSRFDEARDAFKGRPAPVGARPASRPQAGRTDSQRRSRPD
ncbi:MAG: DEAD/DEAH box helicase [Hyphomicrobiaceae bacterium]